MRPVTRSGQNIQADLADAFGMRGRALRDVPGRYATVWWQSWQRVTGSRVTVTGKRREGDLLICLYNASLAGVILPCACAAHSPRGRRSEEHTSELQSP